MDIVRHSVAAFYWRRGEHPASTEQGGARSLLSDRTIELVACSDAGGVEPMSCPNDFFLFRQG